MCSRLPCYSNTCSIHYWTAVFCGRSRRKKHEFVTNWVSKFIAVCIVVYGRLWPPQIAYSVWGPRQDIMSYSSPPTSGRGWGGVILAVHINFLRHVPTPFITYIQLYIIHIYILAQKKLHSGANAVTWCFLGLEMGQLRSYGPVVLTQISKDAACPAQSGRYKN